MECMEITDHKLIYNGDLNSIERFLEMRELLPTIDNWMIGRWLIADPFLPYMIKNNCEYPADRIEVFKKFHDTLLSGYSELLSGPSHIIMKMYQFWKYFILSFPESGKGLKKIKKSKSIEAYTNAVREILI